MEKAHIKLMQAVGAEMHLYSEVCKTVPAAGGLK